MNDTLKVIADRYSCRSFDGRCPADSDLRLIAEAALQAPSGMNRQPWQIIVVKDQGLIADIEAEGIRVIEATPALSHYSRVVARYGSLFYRAPCMIIIALKSAVPPGAELIDCGIVAQNIALAAASLGIANLHCGLTACAFAGDRAAEFKARLQMREGHEIGMSVLLGYAAETRAPHKPDLEKITWIG